MNSCSKYGRQFKIELRMHSIITVTSSFLTKKKDLYFSSSTYNLILQENKNKTYYQNVQKECLIPISKILEI